jgi:integrase
VLRLLEKDLYPHIGKAPITDLTPQKLLEVARRIQQRSTEMAHRALDVAGNVCRYAIRTGRATNDPARDLGNALPPIKHRHYPTPTNPLDVAQLLRKLDLYQGTFPVACALRLAPLVFVRPGELRQAKWADIDLDSAEWRYIASKTQTPHIVPLATQAVAILRELHPLTGQGTYLFPNTRTRSSPLSQNTINAALRVLDIPPELFTGHGFRAMARTLLDEVLGFPPHLIEHQLAHSVRDPLGRAYNRTSHLAERKVMMQAWADYLDRLKQGGVVIPLRKAG